jgi:hypothetical protein
MWDERAIYCEYRQCRCLTLDPRFVTASGTVERKLRRPRWLCFVKHCGNAEIQLSVRQSQKLVIKTHGSIAASTFQIRGIPPPLLKPQNSIF